MSSDAVGAQIHLKAPALRGITAPQQRCALGHSLLVVVARFWQDDGAWMPDGAPPVKFDELSYLNRPPRREV